MFLAENPLCAMCVARGKPSLATTVDHVEPHRGDLELFWDQRNWQSLCTRDHNSTKQRHEKSGVVHGSSVDGFPIDKNHHWNV